MEKLQIHLYEWKNNKFSQIAIIDDYQEYSFEHNLFQAGQFTITINFNIPNAQKFKKGLFVKIGESDYDFGEITRINDTLGENGKGSQIRNIIGYDARYILKRRVIKNMNDGGKWSMTDKGELCLRNLINDQCGSNAESKRQLPILNTIPTHQNAIGKDYSVSEEFSNLYEVCKTIAIQSEIGWRMKFNSTNLILECYTGNDIHTSVFFSPDFDSLANGQFSDSTDAFSNAIYVAGKGQNEERDLYEGETLNEDEETPEGLERFECFDNQSEMTTEEEYEAEAHSMLAQYGQTIEMSGNGLVKCPYVFREQYDIGDKITLSFNDQKAVVQIQSVTERSAKGVYSINFKFGKPENALSDQLQIILRKLQMASNKTNAVDSVKWYEVPTDTEMSPSDVTFNTIGFTGDNSNTDFTFTLYRDDEQTGSKNYWVYIKNLIGTGKLILTSGVEDTETLSLNGGTYVASIYVDEEGNVKLNSATPTSVIESGNPLPPSSDAVYNAIGGGGGSGIPLGGWTFFENDTAPNTEWLQAGTTFDEDTYPELFLYLGGNTVPERFDHTRLSDHEAITLSTNSASPTVIQYDGELKVNFDGVQGGFARRVYVNGIEYTISGTGPGPTYPLGSLGSISVKKGDLVYTSNYNKTCYIRYYKHPLFIKATTTASSYTPSSAVQEIKDYTKDYVDAKNSYSTEEILTGGTWVNGKPIYRVVKKISVTSTTTNVSVSSVASNIRDVVKYDFIGHYKQYYQTTSDSLRIWYDSTNSRFQILCGSTYPTRPFEAYVIFEYTKTTD